MSDQNYYHAVVVVLGINIIYMFDLLLYPNQNPNLGDTGRSPRMQYHAQSLSASKNIYEVTLLGYEGEPCFDFIRNNAKINDYR